MPYQFRFVLAASLAAFSAKQHESNSDRPSFVPQ
jgi:hypothetical protein